MNADTHPKPLQRPASPLALFVACNRLSMQGFGGVLPVAQRELVERHRWLSQADFLELLAISQLLPGPNVVNLLIIVGDRFFGWRGAVAATTGLLSAPLVIVLALAILAAQWRHAPMVAGALRGMGTVAAGLVLAMAFKLAPVLRGNPMGRASAAALTLLTALAVGWLRWPLVAVVLVLGALATALAWRRLRP